MSKNLDLNMKEDKTGIRRCQKSGIAQWPDGERPRERLLSLGEHALTDSELLAILLRVGVKGSNAIELARQIQRKFGSLAAMAQAEVAEWQGIHGLGKAKIAQIKAALELGRRSALSKATERQRIRGPKGASEYFKARLRDLPREHFRALLLNRQHRILEDYLADEGTPHSTRPSVRSILAAALRVGASSLIVAHNHPSGGPEPSGEDEELTRQLLLATWGLEIRVLDHVIVGGDSFCSFADSGLLDRLEAEVRMATNRSPA
jgi:DNA repair protein RadC